MPTLALEDRLGGQADDVYATLIDAHAGLTEAESAALNTRLVLILANTLGDADMLRQAIDLARLSNRSDTPRESSP